MYSKGDNWKGWMNDFRFGTLSFIPKGQLKKVGDELRSQFDPFSAKTCVAHITITQPFAAAPSADQILKVAEYLSTITRFPATIGPATASPNGKLVWLDVNPKTSVLQIREGLHDLDLFRLDLPLTTGFIPHLTISEAQRDPSDVVSINNDLNSTYSPWHIMFDSVTWIVPDENFIFKEHQVFKLKI